MPKMIRENEDIYLAPNILGTVRDGIYLAIDEKNQNARLDPNQLETKIIIYERQVKGWFLDRATKFLSGDNNGFIILMICMSYLEGVEQYKQGRSSNRRSKEVFRDAIQRLYPNEEDYTEDNLNFLYSESRCGLFHNGMVGGKIIIRDSFPKVIDFDNNDIRISPKKLLFDIKDDFKEYIQLLKNDTEMQEKFNRMFSVIPQQ